MAVSADHQQCMCERVEPLYRQGYGTTRGDIDRETDSQRIGNRYIAGAEKEEGLITQRAEALFGQHR